MEGNLGCYNNEVKVQLTISNTSLSSGNKKVTNDLMSGFFSQLTVYLNIIKSPSFEFHSVSRVTKLKKKKKGAK